MMRGRLINPFKVKLYRLDTVGTAADPDGAGELESGYDDVFREPVKLANGVSARKEHDPVLVPCQVEPAVWEALGQTGAGNDTNSDAILVFHFADLEAMGLVDGSTGEALIRVNDRIESIHRFDDETLITKLGNDGGWFCIESQSASFGLSGGARNLLLAKFRTRDNTFKGGG